MSLRGKLLAGLCGMLVLGGCGAKTGDDVASDEIDAVVDLFVGDPDRFHSEISGQNLAALLDQSEEKFHSGDPEHTTTIDPLSWKGTSHDDKGATFDVRIAVSVPGSTSTSDWFADEYEAGQSVRCFRFVLKASNPLGDRGIDCPDIPIPPAPGYETPEIPADAEQTMIALLGSTSAATLAADVKAAFDDKDLFTDATVSGDQFIATVGTKGGEHCLVAVRDAAGSVTFPSFPREWIMPGEIGCHPALMTSPPL